eukprot:653954-Pleurochrysis_carterae.AAC.1
MTRSVPLPPVVPLAEPLVEPFFSSAGREPRKSGAADKSGDLSPFVDADGSPPCLASSAACALPMASRSCWLVGSCAMAAAYARTASSGFPALRVAAPSLA